ncbi:neurofilament medium polypeptide-like [Helianthus annuus]|uniref:neurofilament medium polypeptide-like n=1 Tax=Helianthus annuus TaxID=4232 RepID=UPI00165318C5|nr:neurofilament medium polypeptide-like [Helianthus annuus]
MAEVVEISKMVSEPETVTEDVSVVVEEVSADNAADMEEIAAGVYYYQSEQEVLGSLMKSVLPPKFSESFAGYFEEPKTGSCPRFEEKKEVVEELIDVSKEMTGEVLKDIADKALMGKLKEVDSELETSKFVSSVSVKREESGVQEIKSVKLSESESNNVGKTDYLEQVVEEVVSIPETLCEQCFVPCTECLEKDTKYQELKHHADMIKLDLGQVKEAYDTLASQKAVDDFNAAKKLKEESVKSTFVEYDKRSNIQKPRPKSPTDTKGKKPMVSPIRILKRGESLKSEDKPKSTFEVGESSKTRKTSKIYPKTKIFKNQSWVVKSKPSVEVKKMETVLKNDAKVVKEDIKFEFELDKFLVEFPSITNKVKSIVKEEVPNVTFDFLKTNEKCDVVFGSVSEVKKSWASLFE